MDCLEGMKLIPNKSIDAIICDLPYGVSKNKWDSIIPFSELWQQYNRIIKENGPIILFGQGAFSAELMLSNRKMWRYNLIWEKSQSVGFLNARRMPLRKHEDILIFYKKLPTYNPQIEDRQGVKAGIKTNKNRQSSNYNFFNDGYYRTIPVEKTYPKSILKFNNEQRVKTFHPTQKPVALIEYLIKTYTNEGELILDNCMGSGTTAIAAINTNRDYIGFELDETYYNKAVERINDKRGVMSANI